MGEEGPPSLEYIQAKDLFPPKELVKEEENLQVPFTVLQGEGVEFLGRAADALIAISNYRLHIKFKDSVINVPLRMIDSVESRDMFQLHIACKDSKVVRCHFSTFKQCQEWLSRLSRATARPAKPEDLFAFAYHAWCLGLTEEDQHTHLCQPGEHIRCRQEAELVRMGFDLQNVWRVSHINSNYKLCPSYPQKLLVPVWITDKELENVASFRSWKRIPVVVYRHLRNGAAIARCSQPEISWWGWRNADDEYLVTSIAKACALDPGTRATGGSLGTGNSDASEACDTDFDSSLTACSGVESTAAPQKLLILDARSYTAAVANRAKGGGCECEEYYPNCEVVFMGMANIHAIRNSFQYLRAVCSQMPDPSNWLSALESTKWLQHLSVMLKAAVLVANTVDREGRPVLVHCSDGWDRTPQIVALAKILLDPYYRTLEGFQVLVESDWLDFGHKFGDRCGHQENAEDQNEQCPVFLQWLDSVHQLLKQFPCLFEFNEAFLVKLVQHTYSCLYGTFLANNPCEREKRNIYKRTCSVWALLRAGNKNFHNFLYTPGSDMVLHPVCHVRALHLWTAVYLPASSPCTLGEENMDLYLSPVAQSQEFSGRSLDRLPKTRSMDDLLSACDTSSPLTRTSSDPNLNNHCQETRAGLEPWHSNPEGSETAFVESGVGGPQQTVGEMGLPSPLPSSQKDYLSNKHFKSHKSCSPSYKLLSATAPQEMKSNSSDPEIKVMEETKASPPDPPAQEVLCRTLDGTEEPPEHFPEKEAVSALSKVISNKCDRICDFPESSQDSLTGAPQQAQLGSVLGVPSRSAPDHSLGTLCNPPSATCQTPPDPSTDFLNQDPPESVASISHQEHPSSVPDLIDGEEDTDKKGNNRNGQLLENPRFGKVPLDLARKPISQSQISEFSFLGSNWDSFQGMVTSFPSGETTPRRLLSYGCCSKRSSSKQMRPIGPCFGGQWVQREGVKSPLCSSHSNGHCTGPGGKNRIWLSGHPKQVSSTKPVPLSCPSPVPPLYLDDDGLPFPTDVIQHRLRQIEAGYKQEVEQLRRQVRELQMRLDIRHCCAPPAEPPMDYEDDFTCLKESDGSDTEDFGSDHSEDCLSEASWEPVDKKETEVTRWVPDHMASHCYNCDCEFWLAKRRHHCRNCGNVFCAGCCHLKLPIPDQQLYDPVLVCNSCYEHIQVSRARELMSQHLKKPIATASS
ncbi:myotubularin-related protein 4 isoform X3 [Myotis myotis]|uniref:phosphatidylinositol-3,5-bisphosphate 3-phosphatase n=1 Tax=Myotis myotis TaxID=51298 RepID=A0A7J7T7J4_MYOMY|nr:myotubularin-related protein 4 isoform X3 [Myotis myotis]XP_036196310.1 myotubularin-related protein 4 isoform X3 [Myotis myotis]XP_036196311.1 myotubularin-related protein 4 isoform X3 [Myotis myotis]XP_036196312.1 myotubularin-related protein 4 isoform X3 [Myotis myotis]KAF6296377.1 myotubularin related protein 4 [Myotis myotis]